MQTLSSPPVMASTELSIGHYAEEVDAANALVEMEVNYAVAQSRQNAQQQLNANHLIPNGVCHNNCGNSVEGNMLFCDDECQHEHAEEENKRQHLRNIGAR
jgi:predicted nucleic acid-binding Zn ribbon protein